MFKVGDRVRCIDASDLDERESIPDGTIMEGVEYVIEDTAALTGWVRLVGYVFSFSGNRFALVDEPQPATEIVQYETGAVRSADAESVRYDLISPIALERWAKTCHEGAVKYSDFNWEHGLSVASVLNHGIRHLFKYLAGDRSEDHLAHALWNVAAAIHSEELWPELNHNLRGPNCTPPKEAVKP